jgi:hypothetical protein
MEDLAMGIPRTSMMGMEKKSKRYFSATARDAGMTMEDELAAST